MHLTMRLLVSAQNYVPYHDRVASKLNWDIAAEIGHLGY